MLFRSGLYNIDLSGCHPSIMVYVGAMSRGVKKPEVFKDSVLRRRRLKVTPVDEWTQEDIEFVPAGKLIHNTAYGGMGNKYLPLYDDYMRSKVCRVSQMIIIAVAMRTYKTIDNIKIIQTNTDGILIYMKRKYLDILKAIVKEFEDLSNFVFELEEDSKIWQLNVMNRTTASETIGGETLVKTYAANELNQYTAIANPNAVGLRGDATNTAVVTVNGNSVERDRIASDTVPWHFALEADNANGPDYTFAEIVGVINPAGTNEADIVSTTSGNGYAPPQNETLTYDDDGNLLSDGR